MPTSDALVSTPKPAPCAPGGNHRAGGAVGRGHRRADAEAEAASTPRTSARNCPMAPNSADAGRGDRGAAGDHHAHRVAPQQPAAEVMAERAGARHDREEHARRSARPARATTPLCSTYSGSTGPKLRSTNCRPKITDHHQDEVLEREHVAERRRARARPARLARRASRDRRTSTCTIDQRQPRRTPPSRGTRAADPTTRRARRRSPARRPDRSAAPSARARSRSASGRAAPIRRPSRQTAIRSRRTGPARSRIASTCQARVTIRHRRQQHDEADERPLDHDLAAVAIAQAAPRRREHRRQRRRDAEADAGPHRDLADVGDAELADEQRQKRHHQREAGVAHERGGGDRVNVAAPGVGIRDRDSAFAASVVRTGS